MRIAWMMGAESSIPKVLLGAGKQAAHVINLMDWIGLPWQDIVLFDDAFPKHRTGPRGRPILGTLDEGIAYCTDKGLPALVALGSRTAAVRYAVFSKLREAGACLPNLVHPSCIVAPTASLGCNVVIMPGCIIGPTVTIGSMCCLFLDVTLEHDTQVHENVVFGPSVVASGYVRIGKHAFLGAGAVCAPEVSIGERTLIGAGAVVVSDIPPGVIAIGVPARVYREVPPGLDVPTLDEMRRLGL
jgi:sugar O-acyltransferase (sialic acid O-acetyltransferase NeuD family)